MSGSATNIFIEACKKRGVKKVNPKLIEFFRDEEPEMEDIEDIDLSNNYIGNRGILAVLDVVEKLPNFRSLNISNQKLYNTDLSEDSVKGNATVDRLVDVFKAHSSVTSLDISSNPISNYAGRKLLSLCQHNTKMCRVELGETRVDFDLRRRITTQCEKNTTAMWETGEGEEGEDVEYEDAPAFGEVATFDPKGKKAPDLTLLGGGGYRRKTVRSEGVDPEKAKKYVAPEYPKTPSELEMIVALLQQNVLFSFLGSRELKTIATAMQERDFKKGDEVMSQGGVGDALYVIQTGNADILKEGQRVFVKTAGTAFGELELMYESPCVATVKIATDTCVTYRLDRETYRNLVMGSAIRRREEYAAHLAKIPFLEQLSVYEKTQIADALSNDEYEAGDYIIRYDYEGEWMFILLEGTVEVVGRREAEDGSKEPQFVCELNAGESFGELEFLNNHRTVADVKAKTFCRTAKLNRRHFEMCMGPVKEVLKRNTKHPKYEYYQEQLDKQHGSSKSE